MAKALEAQIPALRLCPDEWITRLHGTDISDNALDAARDPVEGALWDLAQQVLVLGLDVILEFGFWTRAERETFRARAAEIAAGSELYYAQAGEEELLRRLRERNASLPPGTFHIDEARLRGWFVVFEPPTADELVPRDAPATK
jgi:predicted kinase